MTEIGDSARAALTLEPDDALVLFEFLSRTIGDQRGAPLLGAVKDDAELWALNHLHVQLEKQLVAPFRADYRTLLDAARERLRITAGSWPRDNT